MNKTNIIPVILAGGSGSRLWPVSRENYPKQFCRLFGDKTLLQLTAERAQAITDSAQSIVLTNDNYYFLCKDQLSDISNSRMHYILEPCPRNTAPAIALAALYAKQYIDPEATLLILPSDHYIDDVDCLAATIEAARQYTDQQQLVVFGVQPNSPHTGYGYIEQGDKLGDAGFQVKRFVEKPTLEKAQQYLSQKGFFWNSGMFMFKAKTFLSELEILTNDIYQQVTTAYSDTQHSDDFFRVSKKFTECRSASIDYEVMEKTAHATVLPLRVGWDDLGSWTSIANLAKSDTKGNVCRGDVLLRDSENCYISSETRRVTAIGLQEQIIVSTPDAVLVADKAYAQDVGRVVEQMKLQNDSVATTHRRVHRPWGSYECLTSGPGYQVRRLNINPGAGIALQSHQHRSEHWVVIRGEAVAIQGDKAHPMLPNESINIAQGVKHSLTNPGSCELIVIEVQTGNYIDEQDMVRYEQRDCVET